MAKESQADKLYNLQAQQLAAQVANWAATLDFQKERFRLLEMPQFQQGLQLDVDKFAWQKAEDTWKKAYQEALLTGTYNGQPTTQWLMDQARLTGSFNGQRTLEGLLTDAQIQDMHDKMKLANDQFVSATTGYFNGQKTFDRQKFEAAQALEGWKFLATLSGPQNAFKQARAIASTPGGLNQLMSAFAGEYMLPSGTYVGAGGPGSSDPAGQLSDLTHGTIQPKPYVTPPYQPPAAAAPVMPSGAGAGASGGPPPGVPGAPAPPFSGVPGAGLDPSYWTEEIRAAVSAWNVGHPGFYANGSPQGYASASSGATVSGVPIPHLAPGAEGAAPTPMVTTTKGYNPAIPGYVYSAPGQPAPVNSWNYSGTDSGQVAVYPPGVMSPSPTPDVSTTTPVSPGDVAPYVNPPYQYAGGVTAPSAPSTSSTMLLPNQINARNFNNSFDYQKELVWANYEDQGWDKGLAQESYLRSLPKYAGPTKGAIAF
jgi:hypothetical protein